jgi:subtilisin family serine protease
VLDGIQQAAPHVTGMVAVYLETHPHATAAEVADAIVNSSTRDMINSPLLLEGTPNRMLYSRGVESAAADAPQVVATAGPQG